MIPYVSPKFKQEDFNCPLCSVYAHQEWKNSRCILNVGLPAKFNDTLEDVWFAVCHHCKKYTVWIDEIMIYPQVNGSPPPHPDMPKDVRERYVEARRIVSLSPRSAAALLRVSIEHLVYDILGPEKGKDLNESIGILVRKGLPVEIQQSLDFLRLTGNNAVHPLGLIYVDDYYTAISLFELVNLVVQNRISEKNPVVL